MSTAAFNAHSCIKVYVCLWYVQLKLCTCSHCQATSDTSQAGASEEPSVERVS